MAKILIVEDESIVALDIQTRLQRLGYEVPHVATSGEQAIALATAINPDLVLMDVMLQGELDGVETAELIRANSQTPIVFLSAYSDEKTLQRAKVSGPFGYILKPFKERELHTTIEVVLNRHESEKKLQRAHDQLDQRVKARTAELARLNDDLRKEVRERDRAESRLQKQYEQLHALYHLSETLARSTSDDSIYQEAVNALAGLGHGDRVAVRLADNENQLAFRAWRSLSEQFRGAMDQDLPWTTNQPPKPVLLANLEGGEATRFREVCLAEGIRAAIRFLLISGEKVQGEFAIFYNQPHDFDEEEIQLLQSINSHIELAVARKISVEERGALEHQLRESQKMEALGQLAGGIAHDFNNMLTIITGYSELVLNVMGENDPISRDIRAIKDAGERAALLTGQLLVFSRRQVLHYQPLTLNAIVDKMHALLQRVIGEDIELVAELQPDLGYTKADPAQIEQVIMNLVVNSRDAMPRGGKLTIGTSNVDLDEAYCRRHVGVEPGLHAALRIIDTGGGMSSDVLERALEPFFTTKSQSKGSGLGLSTVYGIVSQTGGHLDLTSRPGQGTTCSIFLPLIDAPAEALPKEPSDIEVQQGSESILLVEDEEVVRLMAGRILRDHGYTVMEACRGDEALNLAGLYAGTVHLLLTDVVMPEMSGRELAQHLSPVRPDMKVLYMSGYTDDAVLRHGVQEEKMPFLQKPFVPDTLVLKVREVLDA